MTPLRPLLFIAIIANFLTIILYVYTESQPGGTGMSMYFTLFWMPAVWLTSITLTIVIGIIKRRKLFNGQITKWTLLTMLFATPIPILALSIATATKNYRDSTAIIHKDGKAYITETWTNRNSLKRTIEKHYVADSAQDTNYPNQPYVKDSTWIYFNDNGDTLKVEYYRNDKLISTKFYKEK